MTYALLNDSGIRAAVRDYLAGAGGNMPIRCLAPRLAMSKRSARVNVLSTDGDMLVTVGSPPHNGFVGSSEVCALVGNHLLRSKMIRVGDVNPRHVRFLDIYEFSDPALGIALTEYRFGWDDGEQAWTSEEASRDVVVAPGLDAGVVPDPLMAVEHVLAGPCYVNRLSPHRPCSLIGAFFIEMAEAMYLVLEARAGTNRSYLWEEAGAKLQRHALQSTAARRSRAGSPRVVVAWKRRDGVGRDVEWLAQEPVARAG